ncbi:MAG: T9SS type A sorting domain-containing protein [Chlorobi bacterium]|nr:T9SS type A sorting domain-containing protein [Chlorobiota bacterium]
MKLIIIFLLSSPAILISQRLEWEKRFSLGEVSGNSTVFIQTKDKGYLIAGAKQNYDDKTQLYTYDGVVIKTNENGDQLWRKEFLDTWIGKYELEMTPIILTEKNFGYQILGNFSLSYNFFYLVNIDYNGVKISELLDTSISRKTLRVGIYHPITKFKNGFIDASNFNFGINYDTSVIKLTIADSNGIIEDEMFYLNNLIYTYFPVVISITKENGFIIGSIRGIKGSFFNNGFNVISISSDYKEKWNITLGIDTEYAVRGIIETKEKELFVFAGVERSLISNKKDIAMLYKLSEKGKLLWQKDISILDAKETNISEVKETKDGRFIVAGEVVKMIDSTSSTRHFYVTSFDKNGNRLWQQDFPKMINNKITDCLIDELGNIIIYGRDGLNLYLAKLSDPISEVRNKAEKKKGELILYPNPTSTTVKVRLQPGEEELTIRDVLGKEIKSYKGIGTITGTEEYEIDVTEIKGGIYFITIKSKGGIRVEKIEVVH